MDNKFKLIDCLYQLDALVKMHFKLYDKTNFFDHDDVNTYQKGTTMIIEEMKRELEAVRCIMDEK